MRLIRSELDAIAQDYVSEDELSRNIDLICGQLLLGLESTNSHMVRLGKRETLGLEQTTPEQQTEGYRSVTKQQVLDMAQELLSAEPAIAVISPYSQEELSDPLSCW